MQSKLWFFVGTVLFSTVLIGDTAASEQLRRWNFPVSDIHGRPITMETFLDRVTVVSFSTQQSKAKDMELGQEIGQRFGLRPGYQSIAIPNTSHVPIWARFVAALKVAGAEQRAVREAVERQRSLGNMTITEEEIRKKIIFINDKDGGVWKRMGLDEDATESFVGVIDRTGTLVYLQQAPINTDELFRILEVELGTEDTRWSTWSAPRRDPTSTVSGNGTIQAQD